jgi:hypothetical protein
MYNLEEIKILDGQTDIEELKKEDTEIELF